VNPQLFYGPCRVTSRTVAVPLGTLTSLAPEDHSRLVLILGVAGVNSVQVAPRRTLTGASGITLGQNGVSLLQLDFSSVGPLVGVEWFGNAAAATVVEVIEVFRDMDPERRIGSPPEV
jgi:hypothetical protein